MDLMDLPAKDADAFVVIEKEWREIKNGDQQSV